MGGDSLLQLNNSSLNAILQLVLYVGSFIGMCVSGAGVYQMATAGQNRGHHSHGAGMGLTLVICGALLTTLSGSGSLVHLMMGSVYGTGVEPEQIISSIPQSTNQVGAWTKVLFNILVVLGWIAVIRGLLMLGVAGSRREKELGAGLTHVVAGMLLTNPVAFAEMLGYTLGQQDVVNIILPN